jgi:acetyl-CoA C-acetyltransferase
VAEHRRELGEFCAGLSAIAGKNPYSWFRNPRTPDEIREVTPSNRMISFPYTKSMCSIMDVDQAAALFMTTVKTARDLGISEEKWIYPIGSGDASDIWHVTERENFYSSPSVKVAADMAMEQSGVSLEEIDYLELYSCFPCAPRIVRNMLQIPKDDPRPLTVTGGMSYFGGPGNNYALHGICKMVELLRNDPHKIGLVHALSWYISKHSVGIYSGDAERSSDNPISAEFYQSRLSMLRQKGPKLVDEARGRATVETYTMFHDRESRPLRAVFAAKQNDGSRFLAQTDEESILTAMMEEEIIGEEGRVQRKNGINIIKF